MTVTLEDIRLSELAFDALPGMKDLRDGLLNAPVEICIERARLITEYMKGHAQEARDTPQIFRANAVAWYLKNRRPVFPDGNLLAGSTASKRKSAPLYPEFIGQTIWSELDTISTRKSNPQILSRADAETLNFDIYPYWIDRDVLAVATNRFGNSEGPLRLLEKAIFFIASKAGCISHTVPLFEHVLANGLRSLIDQAREKSEAASDTREFYQAVVIALEGLLAYAGNLAVAARQHAEEETDPGRKAGFLEMAEVCEQVPGGPARNFREAVNSLWFCLIGIHAENINMAISPGRLDQILYPYYRKERGEGTISLVRAVELVASLWLKLGDNVDVVPQVSEELFGGAGTAPAVTLGGITPDGEDAVNDLTYIMLRATELLKLREPNLNARFHPQMNERRYRDRVAEVIAATKAVPAFHNDISNILTLENQGTAIRHARDYAIIGCVELAVAGRSYDASSSIILNLSAPLEMALYNGKRFKTGAETFGAPETGDAARFTTYEQFRDAFYTQLDWLLRQAVDLNEKFGAIHQEMLPTPLLSALFDGPMDCGRDLVFGGARYNSSGVTQVGFADVADSLNAVKAVMDDERFSMADLVQAVRADFKGFDELHRFIQNKALRYGTLEETLNGESRALVRHIFDTCQSYVNYRGGRYRPAYWTMTNHAGQGAMTHALPNGRKSGQPFASGVTPVSGVARDLPECLNAVAALDARNIPGNVALNIKFSAMENEEDVRRLGDFVEGYFMKNGQQVQFNIMSREMLRGAKADPARYPDLLVRVSGYSAYFNDLSDVMKDELISRAEYDIHSGKAVV